MKNESGIATRGEITLGEIRQQPELWPTTLEIVSHQSASLSRKSALPVISGAGSSAYAASAIAESWPGSRALPTTDLLLAETQFAPENSLISIARSGDSPESVAVAQLIARRFPRSPQFAITCNRHGALAQIKGVKAIVLDPRTNDSGLAMTGSFTNLALAGMCLRHGSVLRAKIAKISRLAERQMSGLEQFARELARKGASRVVVLGSGPLYPIAREAALKILEMTAGKSMALAETFLGLRHGPMSFLRKSALVLCLLSADARRRRYEEDLITELNRKKLGRIVAITPVSLENPMPLELVPANAPDLPDFLRGPFEMIFPQFLAYHLSLQAGLNPDDPSPDGTITRVVQGVRIHEE